MLVALYVALLLIGGLFIVGALFGLAEEARQCLREWCETERQRELGRSGGIARRDEFVRVEQSVARAEAKKEGAES